MESTVKERLKAFIREIKIKQTDFCKSIEVSSGFIAGMRESIQPDKLKRMAVLYPELNIGWLMTGEGEMMNKKPEPESKPVRNEAMLLSSDMIVNVPLVNQYAYGGYVCGYNDITFLENLPTIPFIVDHEGKGNYMAFEVRGDSMDDGSKESYSEGDRLLCREIPQHLWATYKLHIRQWDFVIVHEEGILIKRIIDHDVENHTITIHSLNDLYPDRVIDLVEVKQIFNVIESVKPRRR